MPHEATNVFFFFFVSSSPYTIPWGHTSKAVEQNAMAHTGSRAKGHYSSSIKEPPSLVSNAWVSSVQPLPWREALNPPPQVFRAPGRLSEWSMGVRP